MIDWDRIEDLRAELRPADFDDVVEMFLEESEGVIDRLRRGRPDPTLEAELHFLKGSALNLGFSELAVLCDAGERLAAAGAPVDVAGVTESFLATRRAFEAGLRGQNAA
jgi:HPt (histidine-containing phosphotransfer) domain-containing protein